MCSLSSTSLFSPFSIWFWFCPQSSLIVIHAAYLTTFSWKLENSLKSLTLVFIRVFGYMFFRPYSLLSKLYQQMVAGDNFQLVIQTSLEETWNLGSFTEKNFLPIFLLLRIQQPRVWVYSYCWTIIYELSMLCIMEPNLIKSERKQCVMSWCQTCGWYQNEGFHTIDLIQRIATHVKFLLAKTFNVFLYRTLPL